MPQPKLLPKITRIIELGDADDPTSPSMSASCVAKVTLLHTLLVVFPHFQQFSAQRLTEQETVCLYLVKLMYFSSTALFSFPFDGRKLYHTLSSSPTVQTAIVWIKLAFILIAANFYWLHLMYSPSYIVPVWSYILRGFSLADSIMVYRHLYGTSYSSTKVSPIKSLLLIPHIA